MESQKEISRSVYLTISEIDTKFDAFAKPLDKTFKKERTRLNKIIDRAILNGDKKRKENARLTLSKFTKSYYSKRKRKHQYLIKSICAKNGRSENHIRTVAGWH